MDLPFPVRVKEKSPTVSTPVRVHSGMQDGTYSPPSDLSYSPSALNTSYSPSSSPERHDNASALSYLLREDSTTSGIGETGDDDNRNSDKEDHCGQGDSSSSDLFIQISDTNLSDALNSSIDSYQESLRLLEEQKVPEADKVMDEINDFIEESPIVKPKDLDKESETNPMPPLATSASPAATYRASIQGPESTSFDPTCSASI